MFRSLRRVFNGWRPVRRSDPVSRNRFRPKLETMESRTLLTLTVGLSPGGGIVGGTGNPGGPIRIFALSAVPGRVQVYRATDRVLLLDFAPYPGYQGPISVAIGDVNGDGFPDLVTGPLVGNPHVKVFDGKAIVNGTINATFADASLLTQFFAYGQNFNVGVTVAVADLNGDGFGDVITGASVGNPHVKVFDGKVIATRAFDNQLPDGSLLASFFAYALQFNVGVNVAAGALTGGGVPVLVTGATRGNPQVKVYNGQDFAIRRFSNTNPDVSLLTQFFAYQSGLDGGVFVAVGAVEGNNLRDVITGDTRTPLVKVYKGSAIASRSFQTTAPDVSLLTQFDAYDPNLGTGVTVGASDLESTGTLDILTGNTRGVPVFRAFRGTLRGVNPPTVFEKTLTGLQTPVYVGG